MSAVREAEHPRVTRRLLLRRRFERAVLAIADALAGWLTIAFLIAISPGVAVWSLEDFVQWKAFASSNSSTPESLFMLAQRMIGSAMVVGAMYALAALVARSRGTPIPETVASLNRKLAFLPVIVLALPIFVPDWTHEHPYLTVILASCVALLCAICFAAWLPVFAARTRSLSQRGRIVRALAALFLVAGAALYCWHILSLQFAQLYGFKTGTYDLGIYVNVVWHTWDGNFLGSSFLAGGDHMSAHFDPFLAVLAPMMAIRPGAEPLLIFQAVWLASSVFPIYLSAAPRGGRAFGVILAFAYLLHPLLHGTNIFDFHSMTLSVPLIFWAVYLLERRAFVLYAIVIALLLASREDMSVAASCIALYGIVFLREVRASVVTIVLSALYLVLVREYAMPSADVIVRDTMGSIFIDVAPRGRGPLGVVGTLLANPASLLRHLFSDRRVLYFLQLVAPLAFLPILGGRRWIVVGYGLLLALLASRVAVYNLSFHYSSTLIPGAFIVLPAAVEKLAAWLSRAKGIDAPRVWAGAGAAIFASSILMNVAFGTVLPNPHFVTGSTGRWPLVRTLDSAAHNRYETFLRLTEPIRPEETIAASGLTFPHLAARRGIVEMHDFGRADWVVYIDELTNGVERAAFARVQRDPRWELAGSDGRLMYVYRRVREERPRIRGAR